MCVIYVRGDGDGGGGGCFYALFGLEFLSFGGVFDQEAV